MKDKYKELTVELMGKLKINTLAFLLSNIKDEENTSDIISVVLSSHLSSAFNVMVFLSEDHPEMLKTVGKFIKNLSKLIEGLEPINSVELVQENKNVRE